MPQTYTAEPTISIEGSPLPQDVANDILHLVVEESISRPGMFTLIIRNSAFPGASSQKIWQHESHFKIGSTVEIGFRSNTTQSDEFSKEHKKDVFKGEITAIETQFDEGSQAPMIIRGYDICHRLHRGRFNRSFQNMTDSAIVNKVISEQGISPGQIDSTPIAHDYVFQENQTNMAFLRERAARNGFELFIQDGKLNFRKPKAGESVDLKWLQQLTAFQVCVTSAEQVKSVEVRGWDYENKKAIVAEKNSGQTLTSNAHGKGTAQSTVFKEKPTPAKLIVVDQPMFKPEEANTMAQALFDELEGQYIQADAKALGDPRIRTSGIVNLTDMGKYSGKYYVTETRHIYSERKYTTEFSIRGLRGGDLLSIVSPPAQLQPGQTFLVGIVTKNKDPKNWGRVRVKFPTLTEEHESNWARVVTIGAGGGRGFDCLPEINDEVLVGFEHGDIHRPYIIGNVWNGKDSPPEKVDESITDGKVRLRTFKTRTGHQMQFTEEDKGGSKKGVQLKTVYGHQIYMNDSDRLIEITTPGGHSLKMDDKNKKLELKSSSGHSLVLDDAGNSVGLKSSGSLSIEATSTMTIKSTGPMTVQGAIIKLN
jgi:phage protein D/phage baseplate assembly protein gpV